MSRTQRGTALASGKSEKAPQRKEPSGCLKLKAAFRGWEPWGAGCRYPGRLWRRL